MLGRRPPDSGIIFLSRCCGHTSADKQTEGHQANRLATGGGRAQVVAPKCQCVARALESASAIYIGGGAPATPTGARPPPTRLAATWGTRDNQPAAVSQAPVSPAPPGRAAAHPRAPMRARLPVATIIGAAMRLGARKLF